ncbi:unnamed protein product [Prorocentrum cordatum]|uniref:Secreted protein n=1 Tax=Prorocentrum cordatum TaxID=2364126 RepID=A0ABN9PW09_9DINO|nr:unnamed protein product [Polarella glacialis]
MSQKLSRDSVIMALMAHSGSVSSYSLASSWMRWPTSLLEKCGLCLLMSIVRQTSVTKEKTAELRTTGEKKRRFVACSRRPRKWHQHQHRGPPSPWGSTIDDGDGGNVQAT